MAVFPDLIRKNELIRKFVDAEKIRKLSTHNEKRGTMKLVVFDHALSSSFTNLAAQASKVPKARNKNNADSSEEDPLQSSEESNNGGVNIDNAFDKSAIVDGYASEPSAHSNSYFLNISNGEESVDENLLIHQNRRRISFVDEKFDKSPANYNHKTS